ncbi:hypothetical protein [Xanthomonas oryzae]
MAPPREAVGKLGRASSYTRRKTVAALARHTSRARAQDSFSVPMNNAGIYNGRQVFDALNLANIGDT